MVDVSPIITFKHLIKYYENCYNVVCLQRLGTGGSDDPDIIQNLDRILNTYNQVLIKFGYLNDIIIIGHSMGGLLAYKYAQKYSVNKLILLDPATDYMFDTFVINKYLFKIFKIYL